jgi:hypothetical protein
MLKVFNDPTAIMHQALTNPVISALPVRQDSNTDCEVEVISLVAFLE